VLSAAVSIKTPFDSNTVAELRTDASYDLSLVWYYRF
jgi:hypothetical protein